MIISKAPKEPVSLPDIQAVAVKEARDSFLPLVKQGAASVCQGFSQTPFSSVSGTMAAECCPGQDCVANTQPLFLQGLGRLRQLWVTGVNVLHIIPGDMTPM